MLFSWLQPCTDLAHCCLDASIIQFALHHCVKGTSGAVHTLALVVVVVVGCCFNAPTSLLNPTNLVDGKGELHTALLLFVCAPGSNVLKLRQKCITS